MITWEFLVTSLVVVIVPGTGAIYTISTGLTKNWKAGIISAIGCTIGIVPHILACVLGLSAIMNMSAQIFSIIKYAGALYLIYLAIKMWIGAGKVEFGKQKSEEGTIKIALKAVIINLLNPNLTLFFFAFLPLFVKEGAAAPLKDMVVLSLIFMGLTLLVFIIYGLIAGAVRNWFLKSSKTVMRFQRACALMFAAFAVKLVLSEK